MNLRFSHPIVGRPCQPAATLFAATLLAALSASALPPAREDVPVPLSPPEKKQLSTVCKRLVDAYQRAVRSSSARGRLGVTTDALRTVLDSPPKLKAHGEECLALFERETRRYVIDTLGVEATVGFKVLSQGLAAAFEETGKLCPSTRIPVPRNLPPFYTRLTEVDWSDPAWACMHSDGMIENTSVQFEAVTDPKAGSVTFVARGAPFSYERVVEWELRCAVQSGKLTCGEATLR